MIKLFKHVKIIIYRLWLLGEFINCHFQRSRAADNVLWIPVINPMYFVRVNFAWDLGWLRVVREKGLKYDIRYGKRAIPGLSNKKVYYNPGYNFNLLGSEYDVAQFPLVSRILESQNNDVMPASHEIEFWENKIHMHREFEKHGIPTPPTWIVNSSSRRDWIESSASYLYKPAHSKSSIGIEFIEGEYLESRIKQILLEHKEIIVQKVIDISRDCRMIVINEKVFMQYWRNKVNSDVWKPTSTSHGGSVEFNNYSDVIKDCAINATRKLGLRSAAYDIVFDSNDPEEKDPMILEVSPIYYPNPSNSYKEGTPYNSYKQRFVYQIDLLDRFTETWRAKLQ